jgi:hypothetical protein
MLAGHGWQWFSAEETDERPVRRLALVLLALGVMALLAFAVLLFRGVIPFGLEREAWLKPFAVATGLVWVCWALVRWAPRRAPWTALLGLVVVAVDLMVVNMPRNLKPGSVQSRVYDGGWLEAVLQDEGLYRTANEWGLPGNVGCLLRLEDLYGASPLRLQAHKVLADALPRWRLWQLFGVRYVVTWEHDCLAPFACHRIAMLGDEWVKDTVYLHRIEPRYERAWIVHRARLVEDSEALALLAAPEFDPFEEVLLSDSPAGFTVTEPRSGRSTVKLLERAPERMRLRAQLVAPGWLVLGEWHYPGWNARVDGQRQPIYRANYGLRAVPLERGPHEIEFEYRPATFYVGAFLSAGSLALAIVILTVKPGARDD